MDQWDFMRAELFRHLGDGLLTREQAAAALDSLNAVAKPGKQITLIAPAKPRLYLGYIRVSSQSQVKSGLSLESQEVQLRRQYEMLASQPRYEGLRWGGFYIDKAETAFRIPIMLRQAGQKMCREMKPGDQLGFVRLDRGFRNTIEAIQVVEMWDKIQVVPHFMDLTVDLGTATGKLILSIMAAVAQFESEVKSERLRAAADAAKARNGLVNQKVKYFHQVVGKGKKRRFAPDYAKIKQVKLVVRLWLRGVPVVEIADAWERRQAKRECRKYLYNGYRGGVKSTITYQRTCKLIAQWQRKQGPLFELRIRHDEPAKEYRKDDGTTFTVAPFAQRHRNDSVSTPHGTDGKDE